MKERICQLARQRLSPVATVAASLILALLMIFADADQTTCLIGLIFIISLSDTTRSCRRVRRDER